MEINHILDARTKLGSNNYRDSALGGSSSVFSSRPAEGWTKTASTFQPSSGHDPYKHQKVAADQKRKLLSEELEGKWTWEARLPKGTPKGPPLVHKFFGQEAKGLECFNALEHDKYFGTENAGDEGDDSDSASDSDSESEDEDDTEDASEDEDEDEDDEHCADGDGDENGEASHMQGREADPPECKRWMGIPTSSSLQEKKRKVREKKIVKGFIPILNHVISTLGLSETRVAVDTQTLRLPTRDGMTLKPDIFLWGKGSPAFPHIDGKPTPFSTSNSAQDSSETRDGPGSPNIDWPWCCIPIEVKTSESRRTKKSQDKAHFVQLGTYVREVFTAQDNRRFVPSLLLTEMEVEFLLWDRAGVVISNRLNYHRNPHTFCRMLASLVTWDDPQLGFDNTVFYDHRELRVASLGCGKRVEYTVQDTLFRSYTLVGRGSTCWRALKTGPGAADGKVFIIVDSWVERGFSPEVEILEKMRQAGVVKGMASLVSFETVKTVSWAGHTERDTVNYIRRHPRFARRPGEDLVHSRFVWQCQGVPDALSNFKSAKELVCALYDVVQGIQDMFIQADVVHRDIVPWNLIIQRGAPPGQRGVLIDFSHGASTDSEPRSDSTPASRIFRSCGSLQPSTPVSHLDDLESVYYLLCFIIGGHTGPGLDTSRIPPKETPEMLQLWATTAENLALFVKNGCMMGEFQLQVPKFFTGPVKQLAKELHDFLRLKRVTRLGFVSQEDQRADFEEYCGYFSSAIKALEKLSQQVRDRKKNRGTFAIPHCRPSSSSKSQKRKPDPLDTLGPASKKARFNPKGVGRGTKKKL